MGITEEDLVKIPAALTTHPLEPSEWALFYLVMVDLGVNFEKLKEIKKCSGQLNDSEHLSLLLQNWVDATADGTALLDDLISAVASNMERFPGLAKQDFVMSLNQIREEMGLENDSVLSPMEIVFNSVDLIRAEIYKYLSTYDKACLRLTSKSIWNSTLSNWRKTVRLRVGDYSVIGVINVKEIFEIYSKQERGEGTYELGKLIEYPFANYELNLVTISPFRETWYKSDNHFWTKCAPHITSLNLIDCMFFGNSFLPTYVWLVTKICPKIEKLKFESCDINENYKDYVDALAAGEDETEERVKGGNENDMEDDPFSYRQILKCLEGKPKSHFSEPPQGVANNLKVLHFTNFCDGLEADANLILDVAPNLKSFRIDHHDYLKGLATCSEREICKLDDINFEYNDQIDVTALEKYTKTYFNGIKCMNVSSDLTEWFIDNCFTPIYKIISHCSSALVTLYLEFNNYEDTYRNTSWLSELSSLEFPSLKQLQLDFRKEAGIIHFDFATLLKIPNLKSLLIKYEFVKEGFRRMEGSGDWIQNEDSLEGNSLCLDKLEEFSFDGWMVDDEDLTLFQSWFPSLKHLKVWLDEDTSPGKVLTLFNDLKSLTLTKRSESKQDDFIVAKVLHPDVRIFMECSKFGKLEAVQGEKGKANIVFKPADQNSIKAVAMKVDCQEYYRRTNIL